MKFDAQRQPMNKKESYSTSNKHRTSFSESPLHLLTSVDAEMLKNVVRHSVATAFANIVFPFKYNHNNYKYKYKYKHKQVR